MWLKCGKLQCIPSNLNGFWSIWLWKHFIEMTFSFLFKDYLLIFKLSQLKLRNEIESFSCIILYISMPKVSMLIEWAIYKVFVGVFRGFLLIDLSISRTFYLNSYFKIWIFFQSDNNKFDGFVCFHYQTSLSIYRFHILFT